MTGPKRVFAFATFALGLAACQAEPTPFQRSQAVVGGTMSSDESVVRLNATGATYPRACSGTLVAPNLVLTARHCVSAFTDGQYACAASGSIDESLEQVPADAGDMGLLYSFDQIAVYVGAVPDESEPAALGGELIAPETDTICRNDVAFVVLDRDLDLPLRPVRLGRVVPNETVTVVGYGINDTGYVGRYQRDLDIIAVGPSEEFPAGGPSLPRTFSVGQGPCQGDSGGPALSAETGELVGVYSLVIGTCTTSNAINLFTHVGSFDSVIRQAFEAAGHEELLDGPPDPGAAGGAGGQGSGSDGDGGSEPGGGCQIGRLPSHENAHGLFAAAFLCGAVLLLGARGRSLSKR